MYFKIQMWESHDLLKGQVKIEYSKNICWNLFLEHVIPIYDLKFKYENYLLY